MTTEVLGPYSEARDWLLRYMKTARFTNTQLTSALQSDWSDYHREKAAYLLGAIWGRLRQADTSLENAWEYTKLVQSEFDSDEAQSYTELEVNDNPGFDESNIKE